ncbi:MAG: hypothetical protein BWK77_03575 [Verrucomicrobia bacterium A1]|nr:MAG: hypothetical protein BWK77_03575 [Verrucomicrobia bacterium A1]
MRDLESIWSEAFLYAARNSPFYRERLARFRGVPRPDQVRPVDKSEVSARNEDLLCVPKERVAEMVTTSGTAGRPLLWMLTKSDLSRLSLNERLSFECVGLTAGDVVLVAVTLDRCFIAGLAYWMGLQELGCAVVRTGMASPMLVLETIERVRPTAIVGVPSFLRMVAGTARERGVDLAGASVRKAGEPIRDAALALNAAGRSIERDWNARVYSTYGVTELASSLCECDAGGGGHLHEDLLQVEILDEAGQPVPDGVVGEVVATTFGVEAMPLLRYRTGDCAALHRGACPCGRTSPRLGPVVGRRNHLLKLKGTSVFPSAIAAALDDTPGVGRYVILARTDGAGSDTVEVLVHGTVAPDVLRDVLQGRTKVAPLVRVASSEEIERLQAPPNSRKRRWFVDLR